MTEHAPATRRYVLPSRWSAVFDRVVTGLTSLGVSLWGSRVLSVRGRTTGEWRSTPVNVLTVAGDRYLVAPRGHTQWVRNMRVAGKGRLRVGRRVETFRAEELVDDAKPVILRAYLKKWGWEVGAFVENLTADSSEEELRAAASGFPVFRIHTVGTD